jgi:hypothetical protein
MGKASHQAKGDSATKTKTTKKEFSSPPISKDLAVEHLPPIALVYTVIFCSGFLFMFAFRDVFATGRIIGGPRDEAMLVGSNHEK